MSESFLPLVLKVSFIAALIINSPYSSFNNITVNNSGFMNALNVRFGS